MDSQDKPLSIFDIQKVLYLSSVSNWTKFFSKPFMYVSDNNEVLFLYPTKNEMRYRYKIREWVVREMPKTVFELNEFLHTQALDFSDKE